ncbi:MAG: hypothetical protein ACOVOW_05695 [Spirosomataceae bacterium]|nr:hypothetical protein [Flectobacillus sp.]
MSIVPMLEDSNIQQIDKPDSCEESGFFYNRSTIVSYENSNY